MIAKRGTANGLVATLLFPFVAVVSMAFVAAGSTALAPTSSKMVFAIDPVQSHVHWTLGTTLHTVHGTFAVSRGEFEMDPASSAASGEIIVDARSGESGNGSRDSKMHREILESDKFAQIVFRPQRIEGKLESGKAVVLQVHGIFVLHGADHEMDLPVGANISGDHWTGTANFKVPYIKWGLKNPSNFVLRVKPDVQIDLELAGNLRNSQL